MTWRCQICCHLSSISSMIDRSGLDYKRGWHHAGVINDVTKCKCSFRWPDCRVCPPAWCIDLSVNKAADSLPYSLFALPAFPETELSTYQLSSPDAPPYNRKLDMQIEISTSPPPKPPTHPPTSLTPLLWFCSIGSTPQLLALISKPDSLSPSRPSDYHLFARNYSVIRDAPLQLRSLSLILNKLNKERRLMWRICHQMYYSKSNLK